MFAYKNRLLIDITKKSRSVKKNLFEIVYAVLESSNGLKRYICLERRTIVTLNALELPGTLEPERNNSFESSKNIYVRSMTVCDLLWSLQRVHKAY